MWSPTRATCTPKRLVNATEPGEPTKGSVRAGHLTGHVEKSLGLRLSLWGQGPHPMPHPVLPLPSRRQALLSTLARLRRCFQRRAEKTLCVCTGWGIPRPLTDGDVGFGLQQQFDTLRFVVRAAVVKRRVSLRRPLCQAPAAADGG